MKYIAYVNVGDLKKLTEEECRTIDVFNIAFGTLVDGCIAIDLADQMSAIEKVRQLNSECRFVLSVGGWGAGGFSEAFQTVEGRDKFVASAIEMMDTYGLDGIDIDWEYPSFGVADIDAHDSDGENFLKMMRSMRRQMKIHGMGDCLLTVAVAGDDYFTRSVNMKELQQYVHYVMLMTYDLRGGFVTVTGHHANLYQPKQDMYNVSGHKAVCDYVRAGVPAEKLVIGAAFYSRQWEGVVDRNGGYGQMAQTVGGYGPDYDDLVKHYINKSGYTRYWDDVAKAPYLFNGSTFISYEDEDSVQCKLDYVQERQLGGIMYWEVGTNLDRQLFDVLRAHKEKTMTYEHMV